MLIDTHCHINMLIKNQFDIPLTPDEIIKAEQFILQAFEHTVEKIINVGTSLVESENCVKLAQTYDQLYAAVGLHPNDCTPTWREDFKGLQKLLDETERGIIVAVGECGIDKHYPEYDLERQKDAFKAQIELALEHRLPLVVHTRQAPDETLEC